MAPALDAANGIPATNGTANTTDPNSNPIPAWAGPDLTRLLEVHHGENYTTRAISKVSLAPHALFARITSATPVPQAAYTTVQCSPTSHIELNSDLVYINHSCAPNLIFDMQAWEVRASDRGVRAGEELTFFYPSTEWSMARAFECTCGDVACLGVIDGAKNMQPKVLERYWICGHVREMRERLVEEVREKRRSAGIEKEGLRVGGEKGLAFRAVAGAGVV
ncbi:uncharacterized protein K452DRAFT_292750 [Aplosporella prunicola CBS 121167]|uniref:SET domain-containing protein n=1 Tax=Aplosporella prunicola CBS 121167 TaxID=1176127 RepID=A0A6A6AWD0_9PEZI|nr:uncharacterized protein K452DRAFT_292750 [Aplosporella prunicola CBS 121167]KAF2136030.1 hypothetical protein K452DRAFT_292750 [Aplosporella prunicola CBS 121167]